MDPVQSIIFLFYHTLSLKYKNSIREIHTVLFVKTDCDYCSSCYAIWKEIYLNLQHRVNLIYCHFIFIFPTLPLFFIVMHAVLAREEFVLLWSHSSGVYIGRHWWRHHQPNLQDLQHGQGIQTFSLFQIKLDWHYIKWTQWAYCLNLSCIAVLTHSFVLLSALISLLSTPHHTVKLLYHQSVQTIKFFPTQCF